MELVATAEVEVEDLARLAVEHRKLGMSIHMLTEGRCLSLYLASLAEVLAISPGIASRDPNVTTAPAL